MLAVLNNPTAGDKSKSAARTRPGDGRDSKKESNAAKVRDGPGLQGTNGRVGNPQATAGAQAEWDDKKAAYVAAHGATNQAAHQDRQGLPALFGVAAEENFQGKTGHCGSAANFLPAQECQHKKEAAIAHGVRGGRRDHQGSPVVPALFDKSQGKTRQGRSAADFLPAKERQCKKEAVSAHGVGGQSNHPWDSDEDSKASAAPLTRGDNTARIKDATSMVVSKPRPRALAVVHAKAVAANNPRGNVLAKNFSLVCKKALVAMAANNPTLDVAATTVPVRDESDNQHDGVFIVDRDFVEENQVLAQQNIALAIVAQQNKSKSSIQAS